VSGKPIPSFRKGPTRHQRGGTSSLDTFKQAVDLEDACHSVNRINARKRRDARDAQDSMREDYARRKITLSPALDAWLAKEIP